MKRVLAGLLFVLLTGSAAWAANLCETDSHSTFDMRVCYGKLIDTADKELNLAYQNVLKTFSSPRHKKNLIKAESDWIKFRDSECAFERLIVEGGTFESIFEDRCILFLTQERTSRLKKLIDYNH